MITKPYRLLPIAGAEALLCLICNKYSFLPGDIRNHYCSWCHVSLDTLPEDYKPSIVFPSATIHPRGGKAGLPLVQEERVYTPLLNDQPEGT